MPWKELIDETQKGAANGVAELDGDAVIPHNQLPEIIYVRKATFLYSDLDKGVAETVMSLTANMAVWGIHVNIKTAFNDTGADLLDVGVTGDSDYFKSGLDISSDGMRNIDDADYPYFVTATEDITITYNCGNDDADAGVIEIFIRYSEH